MGKSKFPGKPSKLINKKRISVLQHTKCVKISENVGKNLQSNNTNEPTNCTSDRNQKDDGDHDSLVQKFPDKLPSSEPPDGGGGGGAGSRKIYKNHNISGIQTRARNIETNNINIIKNKLEINKNKDKNITEKPLIKKKTVTFKNILETSDDACAVKKVYNPANAPLVPIIKRECLSRSVRLARSDCIVRPSRLTDILKNNSNNIDKLNFLKFKTTTSSSNSMDSNELNSFNKGSIYIDGKKYCSDNNKGDNNTTTRYDNNNIVIAGDKRFVLPKRSVHSCRVIKPNKRFIDDNIEILNKNHVKNSVIESNSGGGDNERNKVTKKLSSPHGYEQFIENINQEQKQNVNFTNNTVKFNNNKLNDVDNFVSDKKNNDNFIQSSLSPKDDTNSDTITGDEKNIEEKKKSFFNTTLFTISNQNLFSTMSSSKVILRQPRLQYDSQNCFKEFTNALSNHSPFTLNLSGNMNTYSQSLGNSDVCGVCGTIINPRNLLDSRKYGIYCCEICRKFISKTTKRSVASTGQTNSSLQCIKGDGSCAISPLIKSSLKNFKRTYKDRCAACWLKKCILICHLPSGHKNRLSSILAISNNSNDVISPVEKYSTTRTFGDISEGNMTKVLNNDKTNEISSSLSNGLFSQSANMKSLTWNMTENLFDNSRPNLNCTNDGDRNSIPKSLGSLSNSLNNNITFGGLPTINPQMLEKPVFMSNTVKSVEEELTVASKNSQQNGQCSKPNTVPSDMNTEIVESNKLKLRKKDSKSESHTPANSINQNVSMGIDGPKRQRIDLKGPRVKHVCRSASIVLGQTIATFPDDSSPILDNMDTPPRPESPNNAEVELADSIVSENCSSCSHQNNTDLGLSPPATPTFEKNSDDSEQISSKDGEEDSIESLLAEKENGVEKDNKNKFDDTTKPPTTRKIARPILGTSSCQSNFSTTNTTRNLNSSSKKFQRNKNDEKKINPTTISIDFWENYDPAEVSQSGFGLIVTETLPMRALCFLCGSIGLDPMIFCACCCEPYHQYCVADEYNFKHSSLDDTMNSLLDRSVNPIENINLITNRLNWLCPRCTVCYTCNMSSGSKVKCQKCQKSYHTTCLGTSKRLLGADRPLICASCLKCKSCGTTKVSKFIGNLPMCLQCFKLRKKGNFCPICQKCYEDNDFDLKMMECGGCQKWVHAKCEGLSDEQYNLLSTLPESIEFICKICSSYTNIPENGKHGSEWRDAVAAEFKSGLLSVVKLLSKRRQACALLKLSPRKTFPTNCICQVTHVARNLQFKKDSNLSVSEDESSQDNNVDDSMPSSNTDDLKEASAICQKCIYPSHRTKNLDSDNMSLVDIKQKITAGDYVSLAEFNYDMNNVISSSNCDELIIAYKEILSEAFPWFQNETKACTDALEEDMFDSCNFSQNSSDIIVGNGDQQVPDINLPDDIEDCLYSPNFNDDIRICLFCKGRGEGDSMEESRLLYCGHNLWVHINCAMWSAEVFEEIDGSLQNVHSAIARGRMIKCTLCGNRGATVGCNVKSCGAHYHYPCARKTQCAFMTDKTVYCPEHLTFDNNKKWTFERSFEVLRPVYVELDRKKKKMVEPSKIKFIIGSLEVKKLGKFFAKFSDTSEAIVPIDFSCTRLYWSIKEPWKIVQYTIRTSIQNNILSLTNDSGYNFTVDHSNNLSVVQMELTQITQWHNSLIPLEETEILLRSNERSSVKQILEAVGQQLCPDETTTEEEPQNNADLLPPEIKDAIFEDLPHEILDGISMLDIFPKLMIYEDMLAIDSKSEGFFTSEYSKDNTGENMSDEEINNENCNKDLVESAWSMASGINHVEDALLSAVRPVTGNTNRDIKRTKTEGLSRAICGSRSQQRSSSLTWSCKLDNHAMKRRKLSKGFQDIRLPDGVVLSLGRRKEDFPVRRASQNDDLKTKTFTWSAAKKYCQEAFLPSKELSSSSDKLKISQLDGMDDFTSEESGDFHMTIQQRVYDPNSTEHPVKCDRCHCTYRTHESYQRHLPQCEPLSTSESESETAPRSPDTESPVQNILLDINKARQLQTSTSFIQNFNQSFPLSTNVSNLIGRQNGNVQLTPIQGTSSIQIQNNGMPITQLNQGMSNIFINAGQQQVLNQQSMPLHQQFIPTIQNINQTMNQYTSSAPMSTVQIGMDNSGQQIFTIAPQQQTTFTTGNFSNMEQMKPQKKQKFNVRNMQSPNKNKAKNQNNMKKNNKMNPQTLQQNQINQNQIPIQIFRSQNDLQQKPIVLQQTTNSQPIILQQVGNTGQPQNIVSYVDSNNSVQYVAVPSTGEFKQPQTPQFLTAQNPLVQGTFLQTDSSGNLVLTNSPSGLQMLSTGSLQLAQSTQPQVIGTLIQPQPTAIQCGVISDQMVLGTSPMDMMTNPAMLLTATANQPMYYGLETIVQNTVMSSQQFVSTAMQGVLSQNSSFSATTTQVFQASKIEPIMEVPAGYVVLNNVDGMIQQPTANQANIISANILQQPTNVQQIQPLYNVQSQQQQQQPTIIQTQQAQPIQAHIIQTSQHHQPQQRTHQIPINSMHSQIRAVSPVKPTAKSTPIIVKKIQPHTINHKIMTNTSITPNTQQQNKNLKTSKAQIIATSISDSYNNPIIITTTTNNNDFLNSIKTSSLTNGATILGQQLKPKTTNSPLITTVPTVSNVTPLKAVQKKMNMIKPVSKVSSVTIKPKIINKSVTSKNSQNCKPSSVPQLIAPKPNPLITDNKITELKNQIDESTIKLNDHSKQNIRINTINNDKNIFENSAITLQSVNNSITKNIHTPQTIVVKSISIDSQDNLTPTSLSVTSSGHCLDNMSNNSVFTQNNININYTSESVGLQATTTTTDFQQGPQMQTSVNLPTSSSIQLPLAPFISPFSSNIPTNIVNPIQQVVQSTIPATTSHIQNNQIVSRPTNRVLPMQTIQPKNIPSTVVPTPSPTETKCKTKSKILNEEQQTENKNCILTHISIHENSNTNYDVVVDKANFEEDIGSNIDSNNTAEETDIFIGGDTDNDCDEMIKFVDKCKEKSAEILQNNCIENTETNTNDFDFMSAIEIGNNDDNKNLKENIHDDICSESTTLEVKEKICEILENLENDECNKKTNLLHNEDNYNEHNDENNDDIEMKEHNSNTNYSDQKENINPISTNNLLDQPSSYKIATLKPTVQNNQQQKPKGPRILYEIQSEDGFTYKSTSITEIWEKVFEAVQVARKAHGLAPLPEGPLADMCGVQMLGLKTNALRYLIEQLPGVERCTQYTPKYHKKEVIATDYSSDQEEFKENLYGTARNEPFAKRSDYDMFSWLASRHRKQPIQVVVQQSDNELIQRRGTGSNLPMAMKYRTLKETYKDYVGVFRSHIHGRGLYCTKDIEAGEMVIEYAGELIRSTLTDKRERYYDSKGIGCYMFKIDDNLVVDATMRGNAARFINHSCEPNCYSKVVDILGHKHIIIFALRRIVQGEELTYDYKFPFEDVKIPCSCGSKRCRKYLN